MKRLFLSALLCIGLLIPSVIQAGRKTIPVIKDAAFSLERNYSDFTSLPRITLHNKGKDEKIFELSSTLTDTDGRIIRSARTRLSAPAGGKRPSPRFPENQRSADKSSCSAPTSRERTVQRIFPASSANPGRSRATPPTSSA